MDEFRWLLGRGDHRLTARLPVRRLRVREARPLDMAPPDPDGSSLLFSAPFSCAVGRAEIVPGRYLQTCQRRPEGRRRTTVHGDRINGHGDVDTAGGGVEVEDSVSA